MPPAGGGSERARGACSNARERREQASEAPDLQRTVGRKGPDRKRGEALGMLLYTSGNNMFQFQSRTINDKAIIYIETILKFMNLMC